MTRTILLAALLGATLPATSPLLAQKLDKGMTAAPTDNRTVMRARAAALGRDALALLEKGDGEGALPLLAEAMQLTREAQGAEHTDTLTTIDNYAYVLQLLGRLSDAEPLFAETLRVRRATVGERDPETLHSINLHGMVLADLGRLSEAESLFAEGLRLRREVLGPNHPDTLASLNNYASVLDSLGRPAQAEPLFAEVLAIRRSQVGDRHPEVLASLNNYAYVLQAQGRLAEAEPLFAEALRLRREELGEEDPQTLLSLANYAAILERMGKAKQAEPLYADALRLNRKSLGERRPATLTSLGNYAAVLGSLGRDGEAEALQAEALRLQREVLGDNHPDTLRSLNNYANTLERLGRAEAAEPLYGEALRLRRRVLGEDHPETLTSLNNYASVLDNQGRLAEAEPLFAEALRRRAATLGREHPDTLVSINNYAYVLDRLGRTEEAAVLDEEALRLRRKVLGDRHPDTLSSLLNLAIALELTGRMAEAGPLYAEALQSSRAVLGDSHPLTLRSLENYALFLAHTGRPLDALPLTRELTATLRARTGRLADAGLRGSAQIGRERGDRQYAERFLADLLWTGFAPDRSNPALPHEAFTALQLASAGTTTQAVADAAASRFATDKGLQDVVRERRALVREWPEVEAALVAAEAGGGALASDRASLRQRLAEIDARLGEIDTVLARDTPQFFAIQRQQSVALDALREQLGAEEAVLFLVPTQAGTHSMAVTRDTIRWERAGLDEAAVTQAVARLRKGLEIEGGGELPEFDLNASHQLYRQLIAPVEDALAGKTRVYVVADGALSRLPLGTLVTQPAAPGADPGDPAVLRAAGWLADRYALVQLPSLQALVYIRAFAHPATKAPGAGFLGFGAPALRGSAALRGARSATLAPVEAAALAGSGRNAEGAAIMDPEALRRLSALPGTRIELQRVSAALGSGEDALRLDVAMTESAIRAADLSGVRVLHLATHAFTSEEAGSLTEPGLVFTPPTRASAADDGYLAASEVVSLALTSARWVILSACNTASPSGRPGETGLSGLAQAFFYAGAESLLVSHWPVFDDIAPVITVETLKASTTGTPRAEALQAAQAKVRNDPALDAAHPAVWAPFSLVGEGR